VATSGRRQKSPLVTQPRTKGDECAHVVATTRYLCRRLSHIFNPSCPESRSNTDPLPTKRNYDTIVVTLSSDGAANSWLICTKKEWRPRRKMRLILAICLHWDAGAGTGTIYLPWRLPCVMTTSADWSIEETRVSVSVAKPRTRRDQWRYVETCGDKWRRISNKFDFF
jgi:hypothetical protein